MRKQLFITDSQISMLEVIAKTYCNVKKAHENGEAAYTSEVCAEYLGRLTGACKVLDVEILNAKEGLILSHRELGELVRIKNEVV